MYFIGQEKIKSKLDTLNLDTFPHTLLLVGYAGCGKHTVASLISERLSVMMIDITDDISLETIDNIMMKTEPYIYIIDANRITEKQENVILKFLEEPLKNSFIIMLCDSKTTLLPTIVNRCQVWEFEPYTIEELHKFLPVNEFPNETEDRMICELARTPGKVKSLTECNGINSMLQLADTMFKKIRVSAFYNILNITNKIAFKNEQDKFDFDVFCNVLKYTIANIVRDESDPYYYKAYVTTNKFIINSRIPHINKQTLFEHYLYELKMCG